MRQLVIQVLLIAGTLAIAWRLLASYGQRAQAVRRVGLLIFAAFAVWSILDPGIWTRLARLVGIGRGADLILYGLVVAFFGFVVTTFRRFRELEDRYTALARRLALDEVGTAAPAADADRSAPLGSPRERPAQPARPPAPTAEHRPRTPETEPLPSHDPATPTVRAADAD